MTPLELAFTILGEASTTEKNIFLDVVPVCDACHQTAVVDADIADLGTEGLPLFEMEDGSSC